MSSQSCLHSFTQICRTTIHSSRHQQESLISSNLRVINALKVPHQKRNFTTSRQTCQNAQLDNTLNKLLKSSDNAKTPVKYGKNRQNTGAGRTPKLDAMKSLNRSAGADIIFDAAGSFGSFGTEPINPLPPMASSRKPMELGPKVGRSIVVNKGDLNAAMNRLKTAIFVNNVRTDSNEQKFHERRGIKRKRMKRERFRKRFKEGFKKMVSIVLEMKRQGL